MKSKKNTFFMILDMGANREVNTEYLIYDLLSLIGTIGGTLSLFIGFSFYDLFVAIIDYSIEKCHSPKQVEGVAEDMKNTEKVKKTDKVLTRKDSRFF